MKPVTERPPPPDVHPIDRLHKRLAELDRALRDLAELYAVAVRLEGEARPVAVLPGTRIHLPIDRATAAAQIGRALDAQLETFGRQATALVDAIPPLRDLEDLRAAGRLAHFKPEPPTNAG